ncbi:tigger transposable element-derived protein 1-like isoform X2 [Eriocheir sinensis]|uniref:tigger transposable element-derived protein 1-like isoform X2 n=1 Tax=Eriocheir sinensis TaxID=95602 RepID=UPI0021C9E822|nr:tigger transposable element-derived protein 1-like isoform X2 [Eriocheir sinensis]
MGPKKDSDRSKVKRKKNRIMVEVKKEIIAKHENGVRLADLAAQFGMAKSTICTILKNKETFKGANVARGVTVLSKRSQTIEEVEKMLLIWINKKLLAGESVTEAIICEQARQLHDDLVKKCPGTSADTDVFKASRSWFNNFKKRSGRLSEARHGEAVSANQRVAEGFLPQQVFNCNETGLFWKRMPKRTHITQEEEALPGHQPMKDRLTLLLCGNASGDFKVKPLLVYHSDNPRVFKKNNVIRSKLPVMWRANCKARVTRQFFMEWVHEVFAPSVKKYLQDNSLPLKCLLVMDDAPAHPPGLVDEWVEELDFITVKFLPPYTAPLIQPLDQQVISNFKKLYTKALFQRCFEVTFDTELTLRDVWKHHFNILHCLMLIDKAWQQVTYRSVNSAWRILWSDCVAGSDTKDFVVIDDIVSLGKDMGLEVNREDVEELLEGHKNELSVEEMEQLQKHQQEAILEEMSSEEEEGREDVPSSLIRKICATWGEVQSFVERHHPDIAVAGRSINTFNDIAMSHFRNILKCRQKKNTLDKFLVGQRPSESQAEWSGAKGQKREKEETPERQLPDWFYGRGFPSQIITSLPFPILTTFHSRRQLSSEAVQRYREAHPPPDTEAD